MLTYQTLKIEVTYARKGTAGRRSTLPELTLYTKALVLKTSTDNLNLERCFEWLREGVKRITAKVAHYHKVIGVAALFIIGGALLLVQSVSLRWYDQTSNHHSAPHDYFLISRELDVRYGWSAGLPSYRPVYTTDYSDHRISVEYIALKYFACLLSSLSKQPRAPYPFWFYL